MDLVSEPERDDRIHLERRKALVDLCLFADDVRQHSRIRRSAPAIHARRVADTSGEIQRCLWSALKCRSDFEGNGKALTVAVDQVAPSNGRHGRYLIEIDVAVGCGWIGGIAVIRVPAQREVVVAGNKSARCDRVAHICEQAGAYMEASSTRENIVGFDRSKAKVSVISGPVFAEGPTVTHDIEAGADIRAVRGTGRDLGAHSQQRCLYA